MDPATFTLFKYQILGTYSKKLVERVLNRGPNNGYCAICGLFGKLSRDHVPPKGCDNASDVLMMLLPHRLAGLDKAPKTISQGGSHFKTLCQNCNSNLLGAKYDPYLIDMCNQVSSFAKTIGAGEISIPRYIDVDVQGQKVARSVVGHILAAHSSSITKSGIRGESGLQGLREYFLDSLKPLPEDVEIYYWIYPGEKQVILKNFVKMNIKNGMQIHGSLIKFPPLAFWILFNPQQENGTVLRKLVSDKSANIDTVQNVRLDLSLVPDIGFPETVSDSEVIFFQGSNSSVAEKRIK